MAGTGDQILSRIDRRLKALGLSQNAASLQAGLSRDTIRSIRRQVEKGRQRGISSTTLERLAETLQTTPEWLIRGIGPEETDPSGHHDHLHDADLPRMTRVVGYVGAGAEAHFYAISQGDLDLVPAPAGSTDKTVAVEIRGDSLGELFNRWLVFYDNVRSPVTSDLIGKLCVVWLADERVLVKRLRQGRKPGLYRLISEREPPIEDAEVEAAAKVRMLTPR